MTWKWIHNNKTKIKNQYVITYDVWQGGGCVSYSICYTLWVMSNLEKKDNEIISRSYSFSPSIQISQFLGRTDKYTNNLFRIANLKDFWYFGLWSKKVRIYILVLWMNIWKILCAALYSNMNKILQNQLIDFMNEWQQPSGNLTNPKFSNEYMNKAYPCIIWVNDITVYSIKILWMKQNNGICIINEKHINFM